MAVADDCMESLLLGKTKLVNLFSETILSGKGNEWPRFLGSTYDATSEIEGASPRIRIPRPILGIQTQRQILFANEFAFGIEYLTPTEIGSMLLQRLNSP